MPGLAEVSLFPAWQGAAQPVSVSLGSGSSLPVGPRAPHMFTPIYVNINKTPSTDPARAGPQLLSPTSCARARELAGLGEAPGGPVQVPRSPPQPAPPAERTNARAPGGSVVKNPLAIWETQVQSLSQEDPLEKEMGIHSSTLAWKIPWTEDPGRLQSMCRNIFLIKYVFLK